MEIDQATGIPATATSIRDLRVKLIDEGAHRKACAIALRFV
jgi:hypothetical protein